MHELIKATLPLRKGLPRDRERSSLPTELRFHIGLKFHATDRLFTQTSSELVRLRSILLRLVFQTLQSPAVKQTLQYRPLTMGNVQLSDLLLMSTLPRLKALDDLLINITRDADSRRRRAELGASFASQSIAVGGKAL